MKLFHVSLDVDGSSKRVFTPRVPDSAGKTEDKQTPRVCFSPTIRECLQAINATSQGLEVDTKFRVFEADLDYKELVKPEELVKRGLVPDALENREYWYLKEIELDSTIWEVKDVDRSFELAWSCIQIEDVVKLVREYGCNSIGTTAEEIYYNAIRELDERQDWDNSDNLFYDVAELPNADITIIHSCTFRPERTQKMTIF